MSSRIEVLVLDDESIVCERLQDYLDKKGMAVETFTESDQALARVREKPFDVIVTDLKMGGYTGMDVLRAVKDGGHKSEVIIITGYATIETSREAELVGAYAFIAKPFQLKEIHRLVTKAARRARRK